MNNDIVSRCIMQLEAQTDVGDWGPTAKEFLREELECLFNEALEEAARVAETLDAYTCGGLTSCDHADAAYSHASSIANGIRALKTKEGEK